MSASTKLASYPLVGIDRHSGGIGVGVLRHCEFRDLPDSFGMGISRLILRACVTIPELGIRPGSRSLVCRKLCPAPRGDGKVAIPRRS